MRKISSHNIHSVNFPQVPARPLLWTLLLTSIGFAQLPDLDGFSSEIDFSILDTTADDTDAPAAHPANHLFINFELLKLPPTDQNLFQDTEQAGIKLLEFPAANYLVAPNPGRIDGAYTQLADAIAELDLQIRPPLKVVLHVDGNFSLALALEKDPQDFLPEGIDISPLPELRFVAVLADIQLLQKDHPPILEAYLQLQEAAQQYQWNLDRQEFYFFPQSPGKVWFALRVKGKNPIGKIPEQE
ncbi:hypothetical protein P0Y35_01430 [Kiritimatiellaeota bacterium B1221]|nr:hypothetical protein [Kiritimatiellaeota bacterium B1221]